MTVTTFLVDLSREECERLLSQATLGRMGVIRHGRPEIVPVNHVYEGESGTVAFPIFPPTDLVDAALEWPSTAFEVDGVDKSGAYGWSVLVEGRAERIEDPTEVASLAARRTVPWVNAAAAEWIRIVPERITGRRIWAAGS